MNKRFVDVLGPPLLMLLGLIGTERSFGKKWRLLGTNSNYA